MSVNTEMMIIAREAEGHTMTSLAALLGISQTTLARYETSQIPIPESFVEQLAATLGRPVSYFHRKGKRYDGSGNFHRKRATMPIKLLNQIHARINELRLETAALLEWAEIDTENEFYRLAPAEFGGPEGVARELRRLWQMPSGPVSNVTNWIEGAGGVVFGCGFDTGAIDGVSQWPLDDDSMPPVFFINESIPGDRYRFTLSHELAHAVMHHLPSANLEDEADRFASEFLMPAADIVDDLQNLTIESAAALKSQWKVSMSALIRRARDLNAITDDRYTMLMKRMSFLGYRKCEPLPMAQETPALFDAVFEVNRRDLGRTNQQMCEILSVTPDVLLRRFGAGQNGLQLKFYA